MWLSLIASASLLSGASQKRSLRSVSFSPTGTGVSPTIMRSKGGSALRGAYRSRRNGTTLQAAAKIRRPWPLPRRCPSPAVPRSSGQWPNHPEPRTRRTRHSFEPSGRGAALSARLLGDGPAHRLPDPPGGVGRELVAASPLELLDCAHEPDAPFLDQVEKGEPAVHVTLGDRDDQAEVGLDQQHLRILCLHLRQSDGVERRAQRLGRHAHLAQHLLRLATRLANRVGGLEQLCGGGAEVPAGVLLFGP